MTGLLVVGLGLIGVAGYYAFMMYGLGLDGASTAGARVIQDSLIALGFGANAIAHYARTWNSDASEVIGTPILIADRRKQR